MPDWSSSMIQTFEYYTVDPISWLDDKRMVDVISSSINWDLNTDTLGSANITVSNSFGEAYIRIYLVTIQNGIRERFPLGTFLVQSPSTSYDGKTLRISLDAYTPLIELKEKMPPIGYSILKNTTIMDIAYSLCSENLRAPIIKADSAEKLSFDFVADPNDTWASFIKDLIANAKYDFALDELSRVMFSPKQETAALQPVWTYNDDNSSILYPEITLDHDMYGIPNVVEVTYSKGNSYMYAKATNNDPDSPISTISRGREILHRVTNPNFVGNPSQSELNEYAKNTLKEMSNLEYSVSYTHGYCPVRIGDCVRINYSRLDIGEIKAKVISQTIECSSGCKVTEKAVYTMSLWGG